MEDPPVLLLVLYFAKAYKLTLAVAPGVLPTRACVVDDDDSVAVKRFSRLLLPTLDRPKKATSGTPKDGGNRLSKKAPTKRSPIFGVVEGWKRFHFKKRWSAADKKDLESVTCCDEEEPSEDALDCG